MQLLRRLQRENARLQAALEWRRRELVFWQWMVRKRATHLLTLPSPPLPSSDRSSPGVVVGSSHFPDRKRSLREAPHTQP